MTRRSLVWAAIAVVAVLVLAFFVLIKPRRSELSEVRAQIDEQRSRGLELRAERDRLRQLQENAPALQAALHKIRELIPKDDSVPNFVFQVQQAANAAGLRFVKIDPEVPQPPSEGASVAEVRAQIGARGGFFTVQDFLRRLYKLDRAVRVDVLTLAPQQEAEESPSEIVLDLQATARIFFELPPGATAGGAARPAGAGPSPAPAASPAPQTGGGG